MTPKLWLVCGGLFAALGVISGAFGAHALEDPELQSQFDISARDLETFEVAVRYQMYCAFGLLAAGLIGQHSTTPGRANLAGAFLLVGMLIFSGLLYALVFSGVKILGAIVPIGGLGQILGWLFLAWAGLGVKHHPIESMPPQ